MQKNIISNGKNIHFWFRVSIILKGVYSVIEIIVGISSFFITKALVISTTLFFLQGELAEDPKDFIANYFIAVANNISVDAKYFFAFYLLSHGLIKILLIAGLLRKKLWAYLTSIIVFSLFIIYQLYLYFNTFSIWLLLVTALDLIIIFLTIYEYRYMKSHDMFMVYAKHITTPFG